MARTKKRKPDPPQAAASPGAPVVKMLEVPIDQIDTTTSVNHRRTDAREAEKIEQLAQSIEATQQLQPIRLCFMNGAVTERAKPYRLVFGHRRIAALLKLGRDTVRAEVRDFTSEADLQQERAVENLQREDLDDVEKSAAILDGLAALEGHGDPVGELARRIGKPRRWVSDLAYLQRLGKAVQKWVRAGQINLGQARELAKLAGQQQQRLADSIRLDPGAKYGGQATVYTVEQVRAMVEREKKDLARVPWELDKGVAGKRACVGCPSNTATEPELFDTGGGLKAAASGVCMNPTCFAAKVRAADKAKEKVTATLRKKKQAPAAEVVDRLKPDWLKRGPAQGHAQRNLPASITGPRNPRKQKGKAAGAGKSGQAAPPGLTPRQAAEHIRRQQTDAWHGVASTCLEALLARDTAAWASWLVFCWTTAAARGQWCDDAAKLPKLTAEAIGLLHRDAVDPAKLDLLAKLQREDWRGTDTEDLGLGLLDAVLHDGFEIDQHADKPHPGPLPVLDWPALQPKPDRVAGDLARCIHDHLREIGAQGDQAPWLPAGFDDAQLKAWLAERFGAHHGKSGPGKQDRYVHHVCDGEPLFWCMTHAPRGAPHLAGAALVQRVRELFEIPTPPPTPPPAGKTATPAAPAAGKKKRSRKKKASGASGGKAAKG